MESLSPFINWADSRKMYDYDIINENITLKINKSKITLPVVIAIIKKNKDISKSVDSSDNKQIKEFIKSTIFN